MLSSKDLYAQIDRKQLEANKAQQEIDMLDEQIRKTEQDREVYRQQLDQLNGQSMSCTLRLKRRLDKRKRNGTNRNKI